MSCKIDIANSHQRRHILADLRPFVCTFDDCDHPDKLYSRRSAWFEHELTFHRRRWECSIGCSKEFSSQRELGDHVREQHPDVKDTTLVSSLLAGREMAANAKADCPFCLRTLASRKHTKEHIANHQKQVALWALHSMRFLADESDGESDEGSEEAPAVSAEPASQEATTSVSGEHPRGAANRRSLAARTGAGQRLRWILFRFLDDTPGFYNSFHRGLCLGQVLLRPRDPGSFLHGAALPLPVVDQTVVIQHDKHFRTLSYSNSSLPRNNITYTTTEGQKCFTYDVMDCCAREIRSESFSPSLEYIQRVMQEESLQPHLQRRIGVFSSPKRLYMVVGLRTASGIRVENAVGNAAMGDVALFLGILSSGGAPLEAAVGNGSWRPPAEIEGPVVLAYFLAEITKSLLGNVIVRAYEKGDIE